MRAIVVAVQLPSASDLEFDASLTELRQLAKTLGIEVVGRFTQKRASFQAAAYLGTGKREELRALVEAERANVVLIDHEISPSQTFTLEKELGCQVMDRTMVILEIFHRHARSASTSARSCSRLPVPRYAAAWKLARFCVKRPTTSMPRVLASWRSSVSEASNSRSLALGNCTATTIARI